MGKVMLEVRNLKTKYVTRFHEDVYAVDGNGKIYETIIFKGYHCETLHGQPLPSEESPLIEMSKLIT